MSLTLVGKAQNLRRKSRIGQVIVVLLGVELLFLGTFLGVTLPTATEGNLVRYVHTTAESMLMCLPSDTQLKVRSLIPSLASTSEPIRMSVYVPEAPVSIFVGYILGPLLGPFAALLFLLLGVVGPHLGIFAFSAGGGFEYFKQPGFGYLIGMIVASWIAGRLTVSSRTSSRQCLAVVCGLLAVHLVGASYLLIAGLVSAFGEQNMANLYWQPWVFEEIRNLTWYALPYDLMLSFAVIGLGFPFRWLVATLTAPDIAQRPKIDEKFKDLM